MVRKFGMAVMAAGLLAVGGLFADDEKKPAPPAGGKVPTTEEIMEKVPGKKGLAIGAVADAKADKWEDAQKKTAKLAEFGPALGKNKPPVGDAKSWAKLTAEFADQMKAMDDAAKKKDADGVEKAFKAFGESCKKCHDEHQKKEE